MNRRVTFYHSPNTRSGGTLALLNELGAEFDLVDINMAAGDQRKPDYLAINPMGKVPAIAHQGALITEQVAVFIYLGDLWPEAGMTPAAGDPLRGPYLRWLAIYGSCFEPALVDKAMKREPAAPSTSPYGDFDTLMRTISDQVARGPWLFGERFTVADVLWGNGLNWAMKFGLVPETNAFRTYADRVFNRQAAVKARAFDDELAARHKAAAGK
jgi:glutathione S-transferase